MIALRLFVLLLGLGLALPAQAESDAAKPDDVVTLELSAENWATTQTARVIVGIEAAVTPQNAGTMRNDMMKAVEGLVKGDWRLVSLNRGQDQTGMERWSAQFEARLAENTLGGLNDGAKKASKAGLQLRIEAVDFTPTLAEIQAAQATGRIQIYKSAAEQLAALNSTLTGRSYRIAQISFSTNTPIPAQPRFSRPMGAAKNLAFAQMNADGAGAESAPLQQAEKIVTTAQVTFAALAPQAAK